MSALGWVIAVVALAVGLVAGAIAVLLWLLSGWDR